MGVKKHQILSILVFSTFFSWSVVEWAIILLKKGHYEIRNIEIINYESLRNTNNTNLRTNELYEIRNIEIINYESLRNTNNTNLRTNELYEIRIIRIYELRNFTKYEKYEFTN